VPKRKNVREGREERRGRNPFYVTPVLNVLSNPPRASPHLKGVLLTL